jgi:beclin
VYEKATKQDVTPLIKRTTPQSKNGNPSRPTGGTGPPKSTESFVVLTQSQVSGPTPTATATMASPPKEGEMNTRLKVSAKLFDAISGRSDIDYPVCTECADILLEMMSAKQIEVKKERDGYLDFLKGLQNDGQVTPEEKAAAEKELEEVCPFIPPTNEDT